MNLEIIYLQLKIITLATFYVAAVIFALKHIWEDYKNLKEFKKREAKRIKEESTPEFKKKEDLRLERLGLTPTPRDHYSQKMACYNCELYSSFNIRKGILEEDFRKENLCYNCGNRLDYKK